MAANNLFAPPTKEELAIVQSKDKDGDLFAPPTQEELARVNPPTDVLGMVKAGLSGAGNFLTLGHYPEILAAEDKAADYGKGLINKLRGKPVEESPSFDQGIDTKRSQIRKLQTDNPYSYGTGTAAAALGGGGLINAGLKGIGLAAEIPTTLASRIGTAGTQGMALGTAQNPNTEPGEHGLNLDKRLQGGMSGGALSTAAQGAAELAKPVIEAAKKIPAKMQDLANSAAFKSTGAMLKDFREAYGKGRLSEIAKEMFDSGLAHVGATYKSIAKGAAQLKEQTGQTIGEIYKTVGDNFTSKVNPNELFSGLVDAVSSVKPKIGADAFDNKMLPVIEDVVKNASKTGDIRDLHEMMMELDSLINHSKRANELPVVQQGYLAARRFVRNTIDSHIKDFSEVVQDPNLVSELKALNSKYGNYATISKIASDRVARESANRAFSLTDNMAAGAGLLALGPKGLLLGGANNLGRKYGLATSASALNQGAKLFDAPLTFAKQGLSSETLPYKTGRLGLLPTDLLRSRNRKDSNDDEADRK